MRITSVSRIACLTGLAACLLGGSAAQAEPKENPEVQVEHTLARDASISVGQLQAIDTATVGTLHEGEGFGSLVWQGLEPVRLKHMLASMPTYTESLMARSIARRLLLTRAQLPEATPNSMRADVLALRFEKLMAMERYAQLEGLLSVVPEVRRDELWYRTFVELHLIQFAFDVACEQVGKVLTQFVGAYWQEKQLFCHAQDKAYDKAVLTVELMREQGASPPPWLQNLMLYMAGRWDEDKDFTPVTPLDAMALAMHAVADVTLEAPQLAPDVWRYPAMMARHSGLAMEDRLRAMEKAVRSMRLPVEEVRQAYLDLDLSEQEAAMVPGEGPLDTARKRAVHYQLLQDVQMVEENVAAIQRILRQYRKHGLLPVGGMIYAKDMRALSRTIFRKHQFYALAPEAFSVLFAGRYFDEAALWLEVATQESDHPLLHHGTALWELMMRLFQPLAEEEQLRASGVQVRLDGLTPPESLTSEAKAFWARAAVVLDGLGYQVPVAYWNPLAPVPSRTYRQAVPQANRAALEQAVKQGRKGEALLLILHMIGKEPGEMDDQALKTVLHALRDLGMGGEAVALAHEVMSAAVLGPHGTE